MASHPPDRREGLLHYRLTIQRLEPNPKYWAAATSNYRNDESHQPFDSIEATTVTLTPEQWQKVQRAIVEALS